ncbi:TRAP transporter TAXI family solute receptor [Caldalkalibacillus uzonensis]|uniref:TRAP transporter TAXI family solute receptor n=1 Tax=Caldalkalibacillus uzonensis TaxID=353224 RepID=A0ABU0CPD5_9BACI|nr:TAXI family TRAP transporter solute-binding subunit [Caldalkalibacillus uzonensis]MDQ0338007.1 TRAP transporter TAXI family solute receptor [Caldalkalibacillus uzonensis]
MYKKWWFVGIMGLVFIVLAACGADTNPDEGAQEGEIQEKDYPSSVIIGTASQGGTYFIYGGGLATLLEEHLGVTANVEVTGGPVHNMQLVQAKDQEIGLVTLGPAYEGYTGTGEWTGGQQHEDVRIIFPMYSTPFHWWALADAGVEQLDDIKGQRVGVGPAGGTSGTYLPMIHDLLGLDTQNVQAGANDMASQMLDGQLDIIGFAAGIPIAAVTEIEAQRDITIFGIDGEKRDLVIEAFPYFYEYSIPADTYDSLDQDVETIAMYNFGIAHKEMNADFIYDFVKAYHENIEQLAQTHSAAQEAVEEAILLNTEVPLHVGAIRYYEEIGIDLPESVYPPEWNE